MRAVPASRYFAFLTIAGLGCAIDLATKTWIFDWLGMPGDRPSYWLWNEVFGFTTSLNKGALFGIGQGKTPLFAVLSVAAAAGILYWLFVSGAAQDWLLTVALGCVTAGIFGNLYDRLGFPGLMIGGEKQLAVRDWLHFKVDGWIDWPIFNIADSLLVCGAALLVWHAFRAEEPKPLPAARSTAGDSS